MPADFIKVFSIGHSTHSWEKFAVLLHSAGVTAIADVRTSPYSQHTPQFNREELQEALVRDGLVYVFLGKELGGRPSRRDFYSDGAADYEKMAQASEFIKGIDRLVEGAKKYQIALMCSEQDPLDCHRCLLVGRALADRGVGVNHILANGDIVNQLVIEDNLLNAAGRSNNDLFASRADRLAMAYRERGRKVAFSEPDPGPKSSVAAE